MSWTTCLCPTLAPLHTVADEAGHTEADQEQDSGIGFWDAEVLELLLVMAVMAMFGVVLV
jgi:hypothetical protein